MKFYLASRWSNQLMLRDCAVDLSATGHEVTSSWIYAERPIDPTIEWFVTNGIDRANGDLADIRRADALILFVTELGRRGEMMFEAGYAAALDKKIIVIGPIGGIFLLKYDRFDDWESFKKVMNS